MQAGKLIHRFTIQRDTGTTTDANGHPVKAWTTYSHEWGKITYLTGDELVVARQRQPTATHEVEQRERRGITEEMRIRWYDQGTERILHIKEVGDPFKGRMNLLCVEAK